MSWTARSAAQSDASNMGGHPYWYVVPYERDIDAVLEKLKLREFDAGRYNPVIPVPEFPIGPDSPSPGRQHASIEDAILSTDGDGTRSILDMVNGVLRNPYKLDPDQVDMDSRFAAVSPSAEQDLIDLFGDAKPSRQAVVGNRAFWNHIDRGTAVYVVLYSNCEPHENFLRGLFLRLTRQGIGQNARK